MYNSHHELMSEHSRFALICRAGIFSCIVRVKVSMASAACCKFEARTQSCAFSQALDDSLVLHTNTIEYIWVTVSRISPLTSDSSSFHLVFLHFISQNRLCRLRCLYRVRSSGWQLHMFIWYLTRKSSTCKHHWLLPPCEQY